MAIVRTDDTHYQNIAAALRQSLGTDAAFTPAQMADGAAQCARRHFVTAIPGTGEDTLSFSVPFAPDCLYVFACEAGMYGKYKRDASAVGMIHLDFAGFGMIGGIFHVYWNSSIKSVAMTTSSIHSRYSRTADGLVTLQNISDTSVTNSAGEKLQGIFAHGCEYVVVACKYLDQTDKERITAYVRSLTGSGSVTLNKAKVDAAFTAEEWAALAAEKPGWAFSFI